MTDIDTLIGLKLELEARYRKLKQALETKETELKSLQKTNFELTNAVAAITGINEDLRELVQVQRISNPRYIQ